MSRTYKHQATYDYIHKDGWNSVPKKLKRGIEQFFKRNFFSKGDILRWRDYKIERRKSADGL